MTGHLILARGQEVTKCKIVDLSEGGARINAGSASILRVSDEVHLYESKDGNIFECVVRWTKGLEVGLQFVDICGREKRRHLIERHRLD
jgi:hypothetical protein